MSLFRLLVSTIPRFRGTTGHRLSRSSTPRARTAGTFGKRPSRTIAHSTSNELHRLAEKHGRKAIHRPVWSPQDFAKLSPHCHLAVTSRSQIFGDGLEQSPVPARTPFGGGRGMAGSGAGLVVHPAEQRRSLLAGHGESSS